MNLFSKLLQHNEYQELIEKLDVIETKLDVIETKLDTIIHQHNIQNIDIQKEIERQTLIKQLEKTLL